mmetsp:Transcript_14383/g.22181  ORF Transcript_14383/g.22181 Transcript_14383/m.22181 type:complete len:157 (+) Transcript_14383:1569-2039(+)
MVTVKVRRISKYRGWSNVDRGRDAFTHDGTGSDGTGSDGSSASKSSDESARKRSDWYNSLGRRKRRGHCKRSISPSQSVRLSDLNVERRDHNDCLSRAPFEKVLSTNVLDEQEDFQGKKNDERDCGGNNEDTTSTRFSFIKMLCTSDILVCSGVRC